MSVCPPVTPGTAVSADGSAATPGPPSAAFALPYRVVYAVATLDTVTVYDTGEPAPLAVVCGALHCSAITDMAWSPDGQYVAVSSYDGYCSVLAFDAGELGTPVSADKARAPPRATAPKTEAQGKGAPASSVFFSSSVRIRKTVCLA